MRRNPEVEPRRMLAIARSAREERIVARGARWREHVHLRTAEQSANLRLRATDRRCGRHELRAGMELREIAFGDQKLTITNSDGVFHYKRHLAGAQQAEASIVSDKQTVVLGIFPVAPLLTPSPVAQNVYVKFKAPIVIDQGSDAVVYTKIPIEIGVYRQSGDEELLIDAFSLQRPRYALYGSSDAGASLDLGIGGSRTPGNLKCLHAHVAFALARPGYLLGDRILAEIDEPWPRERCCSAAAPGL